MLKVQEALLVFYKGSQDTIQKTMNLKPNVNSDVALKLKDSLDRFYEKSCSVADDQTETKEALTILLDIIMKSVRDDAGDNQELDQEEVTREAHLRC